MDLSPLAHIREEIASVIVGQDDAIDGALMGLLAGGHVLFQSVPGLGKTLLATTLSQTIGLTFRRLQCTPDTTPTDILGTAEHPGPIFTQVLLADELNRAHPQTQAALLEAMQEHRVTRRGVSLPLPSPFLVLATQNPIEQEGTFTLPEAQLDRFLLEIHLEAPSAPELHEILRRTTVGRMPSVACVLDEQDIRHLQQTLQAMPISDGLLSLATRLVLATHPNHPSATRLVRSVVLYGSSPRGGQALIRSGKAHAMCEGRDTLTADDLWAVLVPALQHRIILNFEGLASGIEVADVVRSLRASL